LTWSAGLPEDGSLAKDPHELSTSFTTSTPASKKAVIISTARDGVGAARQCDLKPGGWFKEKVAEWKPGQALAFELFDCTLPVRRLRHSYTFTAEDGGTLVTQHMEYVLKFGVLGKLMDAMMVRKKWDAGIKSFFAGLKQHVETGGSPSSEAYHLPDLGFVLDDLTAAGAQRVRKRPMPAAAMLTALSLLGFPRREAIGILRQLAELFAALPQNRAGTETLTAVVCYLLEVADPEPDPEQVRCFFESNVGQYAAEVAMSAAGRLRQQGREEGLAEGEARGEARGRAAVLLSQLTLKFGLPSDATQRRVMGASIEQLDAFAARVLSANSLREVLDPQPPKRVRAAKKAPKKKTKRQR
jgi:hypothetical protein